MREKLATLVATSGVQQTELAAVVGCSKSNISRKLAGICKLDKATARLIYARCCEQVTKATKLVNDNELKHLND